MNVWPATAASTSISGYIDEIVLESPSGVTSGAVAVVATQPMANTITLVSKTVLTTDVLVRPRLDATDAAGSAVTGDETWRYFSYGDSIAATVTDAEPTGLTWQVWIKYDDGR